MGKLTGFLEYERKTAEERCAQERIQNWDAFHPAQSAEEIGQQAARCMNCGVPFCHAGVSWRGVGSGCSLGNLIPEWNHLVFKGHFEEAYRRLEKTNLLHECTSRVCPALCEGACTCGMNGEPVAIREVERFLSDMAWENGWVVPRMPKERNGKSVAVVGSGPAGLTAAHILNQRGFSVTVFEKSEEPGGLLMFGIPNMKLPKERIRQRVEILRQEGISFADFEAVYSMDAFEFTSDQLTCVEIFETDHMFTGKALRSRYQTADQKTINVIERWYQGDGLSVRTNGEIKEKPVLDQRMMTYAVDPENGSFDGFVVLEHTLLSIYADPGVDLNLIWALLAQD